MFGIDDLAIATSDVAISVAEDIATEIATDGVSEAVDIATELSYTVKETASEIASEEINEIVLNTDGIVGDNIGEVSDVNSVENTDGKTKITGDDVGETPTNTQSDCHNVGKDIMETERVEDDSCRIKTINEGLVGQPHPDTGVLYVEKEVVTDTGEKVKGVFPQFESKFDVHLPEEMEQASDRTQFAECNKQLAEKVSKDPELRAQFTEDQLSDIEDGYTPDGYTWHHNEEKGKMQLVDSDIHSQTRHTGGRNIWGGGTESRH